MSITNTRLALRRIQNGKCCYCRVQMTKPQNRASPTSETIEHLQRKCEGGKNGKHNLALACHACNTQRGAMNWLVYATYKAGEPLS